MQKTVKIFHSFEEEERENVQYWKQLDGSTKLEILDAIRANYWMLKNEYPEGFQRIYRIVKREQS